MCTVSFGALLALILPWPRPHPLPTRCTVLFLSPWPNKKFPILSAPPVFAVIGSPRHKGCRKVPRRESIGPAALSSTGRAHHPQIRTVPVGLAHPRKKPSEGSKKVSHQRFRQGPA